MTRSDLVKKLLEIYPDIGTENVEKIISIVFNKISSTLQSGDRIELRGFGSFSVRTRAAGEARNPKTGEKVAVSERKVVFFKPGKQLKDLINGRISYSDE